MDTILLTGKTDLFSKEILHYTGETAQIFLTGQKPGKSPKVLPDTVHVFPASSSDSDFRKVFELGAIRAVWHVAKSADGGRSSDENREIEQILSLCSYYGVSRMILLTDSRNPEEYRKMIAEWGVEREGNAPVDVAVVRLPLLTGSGLSGGRLDRIFKAMREDKTVCFDGKGDERISILSVRELFSLLMRMSLETWFRAGIFDADGNTCTKEELRTVLLSIRPGARIEYSKEHGSFPRGTVRVRFPAAEPGECDGQLGEIYRLPVSSEWDAGITGQYTELVEEAGGPARLRERISGYLGRFGKLAGTMLDLLIMFIVAEYLAQITSASVYFKIVDVRLIFVVFMGAMHGIAGGFAAAGLECIMLVLHYNEIGISGLLLFYNVENWIPFVYYLAAGAISGYSHQKKEQEVRSVTAENELIRNKYLFLNEAYRTSVANRKDLWAQILNEEESYARIYGAVRRMSQRTPEAVCVEAVQVLRHLLNNDTVSIYQLDRSGKKAGILSCCRDNAFRQSIDLSECGDMMGAVQKGDTWKNIHFIDNAPMYAAQVQYSRVLQHNAGDAKDVTYLVTVEKAGQDQLSLWYMNHFTILCGLFQEALENASLRERTLS